MNKLLGAGDPSRQSAKMNRQRLFPQNASRSWTRSTGTRLTCAQTVRLRELRLANEAQEVRTEISAKNQLTKAKPKQRLR